MQHKKTKLPMLMARAGFVPATFSDKENTVDIVWTTGGRVLRQPFFEESFYEDLVVDAGAIRLERLNLGAPLLNNHSSDELADVIGVVQRAWIQDGKGMATVQLSRRPEVSGIVQDIKDGVLRNISVGYMVHKYARVSAPEGVETTEDVIPVYEAIDWEPMELSFVGIPADAGAQVRKSDLSYECELIIKQESEANAMGKRSQNPEKPEQTEEIPAVAPSEIPAEKPVVEIPEPKVEGEPEESSPETPAEEGKRGQKGIQTPEIDVESVRAEAQKAEHTRQLEIRKAVKVAKLGDEFAEKLTMDSKMTLDNARAAIFSELEKQTGKPTNNVRVEGAGMELKDARREAATRVLLNQFDPKAFALKEGDNELRAHSVLGMARKILSLEGVTRAHDMSPKELSERALHTTSDFPLLLANVANKSLQKGYEQAANTYEPFVTETSVPDFKPISSLRLSDGGTLQKVNEHGEYRRGSMVESGETYQVETYGLIIGATRKLLMNDDLGAFTKIPQSLGMRAKQKENELFWQLIIANAVMSEDSLPLMDAGHGNTQAQAAISIASLATARAKMRGLMDMDKQPINLTASYIVVPTALETVAEQFVAQVTPNQNGQVNPFAGRLQVIVEPRLDANSSTAWYLFADKSKIPMVELARIDGQGPRISVREGFDIDGMETKISYDFGMKAVDFRGFFKTLP